MRLIIGAEIASCFKKLVQQKGDTSDHIGLEEL
jgi:hypothetical protein